MKFFSRHEPTEGQQAALGRLLQAHGPEPERLERLDLDLAAPDLEGELVRHGVRPFEAVAAVGPAHLLERVRRTGRPVIVFAASARGQRVDEAGEAVEAHVLPGLRTGAVDEAVHGLICGTLVEITLSTSRRLLREQVAG